MEGTESSHLEHKKKSGIYGEILTAVIREATKKRQSEDLGKYVMICCMLSSG